METSQDLKPLPATPIPSQKGRSNAASTSSSKVARTATVTSPSKGKNQKKHPHDATIAFLRREADQAQERAKRLRAFAATLEAQKCDYETAPLDENGVPKYKGKKRGRKPKKRLRKRNPNAKKRSHTAYTLYVQETYPKVRQQVEQGTDGNEFQSKNVISIVAKQWKDVPNSEKEEWKRRAQELSSMPIEDGDPDADAEEEEDDPMNVEEAMAIATLTAEQGHAEDHEPAIMEDQIQKNSVGEVVSEHVEGAGENGETYQVNV